jgi:tetratricopeptide (TPR) repeat protein
MLKNAGTFLKKNTYYHNFLFFTGGDQPELTPSLQVFVQILKDHAPKELEWVYDPMPRQDHGSLIPFTIYEGLKKLYSDWRELPGNVITGGKRELNTYRDRLAKKFGYDIGISEISVRSYGWQYMREKRFTKAIALFKLNTEINPDSADAHYSLGRAYEAAGQLGLAKENYEIACKMADNLPPSMLEMYKNSLEKVIKKMRE